MRLSAALPLSLRRAAPAILFGACCSLFLNAPTLFALFGGFFSLQTLGVTPTGSIDELYYAALIRKAADGYLGLGNVSIFEHRFEQSVLGYAPLLQGVFLRLSGLSLAGVIFLGDIVFPWIAGGLLFSLVRRIDAHAWSATFGAAMLFGWKAENWLRLISPQVTGVLFLASVLTLFGTGTARTVTRACCIAALFLLQPVYAALLLLVEGMLFCVDVRTRGWRESVRDRRALIVLLSCAMLFRAVLLFQETDALALADTYRRLGLTPTRLPAAPALQVKIVAVLLAHAFVLWSTRSQAVVDRVIVPVLLVAALASLWLSVVTGVDGNFGLYLSFPIVFILGLVCLRDIALLAPLRMRTVLLGGLSVLLLVSVQQRLLSRASLSEAAGSRMEQELSLLLGDKPGRIVAAPLPVSNMIPAVSPHFVLFSQYARFQYARDEELAWRYLAQQSLFPDESVVMEGYPLVFGLYAGNLSARTRTWCRMKRSLGLTDAPCDLTLVDSIYHQDVLRFVDAGEVDTLAVLHDAHVNSFVTDAMLPVFLQPFCSFVRTVEPYSLYDCNFGR